MKILENEKIVSALIIGLAIVIVGLFGVIGINNITSKDNVITVTGGAERFVESDTIKLNINISTSRSSQRETVGAIRRTESKLEQMMLKAGYLIKDITTGQVSTYENCRVDGEGNPNCSLGIASYTGNSSITLETDKIDEVLELITKIENTGDFEAVVNSYTEYYFNGLKDIRAEMIKEATLNAKERAQAVAESTGSSIGSITEAQSGVFQVMQRNSVDVSDYGSYDTSTRHKKVTATIKVKFKVD